MEIKEIGNLMKKNLIFLMVIVLVAAILGALVSMFVLNKEYTASAMVIVSSNAVNQSGVVETMTASDYDLNIKMVNSYSVLIKSPKVLNTVIDQLGLNITPKELLNMVQITSESETEILKISATSTSPKLAKDISNSLVNVFMNEVTSVMKRDNVKVFDYATLPSVPVKPNILLNTGISLLIGLFLGILIIFMRYIADDTIRNPEQIAEIIDIPVIGNVANLKKQPKEALNMVRSNLELLSVNHDLKIIMIMSAMKGEGKSTIAAKLANSMVATKNKILIIDADNADSGIQKLFTVANRKGLSNLISALQSENGFESRGPQKDEDFMGNVLDQFIVHYSLNIDLLTAGNNPMNPAEMLTSKRMKSILLEGYQL